jgi:hypothetical protein
VRKGIQPIKMPVGVGQPQCGVGVVAAQHLRDVRADVGDGHKQRLRAANQAIGWQSVRDRHAQGLERARHAALDRSGVDRCSASGGSVGTGGGFAKEARHAQVSAISLAFDDRSDKLGQFLLCRPASGRG